MRGGIFMMGVGEIKKKKRNSKKGKKMTFQRPVQIGNRNCMGVRFIMVDIPNGIPIWRQME